MKNFHLNDYERAFGNWLIDNRVNYIAVDEQKRAAFGHSNFKSFDYLLNLSGQQTIIAEVKGRAFKGTSFAKLAGFECWVGTEDVDGLTQWQEVFGSGHTAAFIFAYRIENVDVDFDGREVYDFNGKKYVFFCVKLGDYRKFMKVRSPSWKTVTLPAEKFRQCAVQMQSVMV
ncbi:MAG: HYExAFE family protein [Planctomycetes bacterium]|nr:HYExAFE family protein [Planctomycetota bacterium]